MDKIFHRIVERPEVGPHPPKHIVDSQNEAIDVVYTANFSYADQWIREYILDNRHNRFVGIDIEWKPNRSKYDNNPAALLQISTHTHTLVLHLFCEDDYGRFQRPGPNSLPQLIRLLKSRHHLMCGVDVRGDLLKLTEDFDIPATIHQDLYQDLGKLARCHYERALKHFMDKRNDSLHELFTKFSPIFKSNVSLQRLQNPPYCMPAIEFFDLVRYQRIVTHHGSSSLQPSYRDIDVLLQRLEAYLKILEFRLRDLVAFEKKDDMKATNGVCYDSPLHLPALMIIPGSANMIKTGLEALADRYLGYKLEKNRRITLSNWELYPLSDSQVEYAALDAWISTAIIREIERQDPHSLQVSLR